MAIPVKVCVFLKGSTNQGWAVGFFAEERFVRPFAFISGGGKEEIGEEAFGWPVSLVFFDGTPTPKTKTRTPLENRGKRGREVPLAPTSPEVVLDGDYASGCFFGL